MKTYSALVNQEYGTKRTLLAIYVGNKVTQNG